MQNDLTRLLVESTVRRTLKNIQESPERAIRNLVDLGVQFSSGRFQSRLMAQAQKMLQNQKSAYYALVKDAAASVDPEILTTFGVNLGYNSCTRGARLIREIEAEKKFNIPWALSLAVNAEKLAERPDFYPSVLRQGTALGIYTYLLFAEGEAEMLLPLLKGQPDCAFVLFLRGRQVDGAFLEKFRPVRNVMISVCSGEGMAEACRRLRGAGMLYAVHRQCAEQDREEILGGGWLRSILPARPAFGFLRADPSCTPRTRQEIYQYVTGVRDGQQYPLFLMDLRQDLLLIDRVISDGECLAGFEADGSLRTHEGVRREERCNLFCHPLEEILRSAAGI